MYFVAVMPSRVLGCLVALAALILFVSFASSSTQRRPGVVDTSFGSDGIVMGTLASYSSVSDLALQPDGKIVVALDTYSYPPGLEDFALARLNPDGSVDQSFGSHGFVTTDFSQGPSRVRSVAIEPDGKIVAAGGVVDGGRSSFALARYNQDGSLDPGFGSDGEVTTAVGQSPGYFVNSVLAEPDGDILAGGGNFIARYKPDGSLDQSFGQGGVIHAGSVAALALQPDGEILAAGDTGEDVGDEFTLERYLPNGSFDPAFNHGHLVATQVAPYSQADAVTVQPDGKIVVGGYAYGFGLVRYNPDGSLDQTFGDGGIVATDLTCELASVSDLALQPDGDIIAVGECPSSGLEGSEIALLRFRPSGRLDPSFGRGGSTLTPVRGWTYAHAGAVALGPDGKIVLAGGVGPGDNSDNSAPVVARYFGGIGCFVPSLVGKEIVRAKQALAGAHCGLGRVHWEYARRFSKERVISQWPRAHTNHPAGTKVNLVVSKGTRR